jgi:hypothetical protein
VWQSFLASARPSVTLHLYQKIVNGGLLLPIPLVAIGSIAAVLGVEIVVLLTVIAIAVAVLGVEIVVLLTVIAIAVAVVLVTEEMESVVMGVVVSSMGNLNLSIYILTVILAIKLVMNGHFPLVIGSGMGRLNGIQAKNLSPKFPDDPNCNRDYCGN